MPADRTYLRALQVFVSVATAHGFTILSGAWRVAEKTFHIWWSGVSITFAAVFAIMMFFTIRGRLATTFWAIPTGALIGHLAAVTAYVSYFAVAEPERLLNTVRMGPPLDWGVVLITLVPMALSAWLYGAIAAAAFLSMERYLARRSGQL
jgi:hypothetical protein